MDGTAVMYENTYFHTDVLEQLYSYYGILRGKQTYVVQYSTLTPSTTYDVPTKVLYCSVVYTVLRVLVSSHRMIVAVAKIRKFGCATLHISKK